MQNIILHPYQSKLKGGIYNDWNSGAQNVLAQLPTGGGKSIIVSDVVLDGANLGMVQAIVAHRNELVSQMSVHIANRGIPHRIVGPNSTIAQITRIHRNKFNGRSFINPSAKTSVVGVDTMIARSDDLKAWAAQHDRWIIDECFPAGTSIQTPDGDRNIETLKTGELVTAFCEKTKIFKTKKINRLFKNPIHNEMVYIKTLNGVELVCTREHPIWTQRGWVVADKLTKDDVVLYLRGISKYVGLESIEIRESSNNKGALGDYVYNIEVDELHTYVANNLTVHNCHHVTKSNKWGKAVNMFNRAQGLGVTATPSRADGQGLGRDYDGVFDTMVLGPTMREIISLGNLSDYEIVCPESDIQLSDDDIGESGDYSKQKLKSAAEKSKIVGDVVKAYCMYAYGKKAICFATDVKTASKIADNFNNAGIRSASLSAETPLAVREKYLEEFKTGKLWVLVNVDLFDEGFDISNMFAVIMARPTASLAKYLQMVGRALRTADDKTHALIIDHVSNVKRHNLPDKDRIWTLARRDKRAKSEKDPEDIPLTVCKSCSKPYERFRPSCPYCGFVPIIVESQARTIDIVDGDLILLDRAALEKMRKATQLESPGSLAERVARVAGEFAAKGVVNKHLEKIAAQEKLSNAIAQWASVQRIKGRDDSESYRRFYITTGVDVLSALSADKTRQEYEQMTQMVEKWYIK